MNRRLARTALLLLAAGAAGCTALHAGPPSDHFDGQRFFNPGVTKSSSPAGYLWRRLTDAPADWAPAPPAPPAAPLEARVEGGRARVSYVGHATLLIQVAGLNILTDPVWSERASPVQWLGPRRVAPPAWPLEALPRIDVVLISHDHHDHTDLRTLAALDARHRPRVIVPLGLRALVAEAMPGSRVSEHDWGERVAVAAATVHVEPMLHGSGRTPFDQMRRLWAAYVVEADGLKIYHVADSGYGDGRHFRAAAAKHGRLDLAILPIGAYEPVDFMADSHMTPAEAVKAWLDSGAAQGLAHHFDTFQLGFEAQGAAPIALRQALAASGADSARFAVPVPGQTLTLARHP